MFSVRNDHGLMGVVVRNALLLSVVVPTAANKWTHEEVSYADRLCGMKTYPTTPHFRD